MDGEQKVRRVVTGLDAGGKSMIVSDTEVAAAGEGAGETERAITQLWTTVSDSADGASEFRVVDMPAGCRRDMHRTDTIDYGLVLAGEITLVLETQETVLRAGDVVVQRGTLHGWHNRSYAPARLAFINMRGQASGSEVGWISRISSC